MERRILFEIVTEGRNKTPPMETKYSMNSDKTYKPNNPI
jgi:hypothetical protein